MVLIGFDGNVTFLVDRDVRIGERKGGDSLPGHLSNSNLVRVGRGGRGRRDRGGRDVLSGDRSRNRSRGGGGGRLRSGGHDGGVGGLLDELVERHVG